MKNKMTDLNDHLFLALERLNDEELTNNELDHETKRSRAIVSLSNQILKGAKTTIDALKLVSNGAFVQNDLPETLGLKK